LQLPALSLDCTKQVLPRSIKGLCALRLQIGRQLFEIDSRFSKVVQNRFAVSSIARKGSGQFAMIRKGQKSLFRYGVDRVWRSKSGDIKNVRSLRVLGTGAGKKEPLGSRTKVGQTLPAIGGQDLLGMSKTTFAILSGLICSKKTGLEPSRKHCEFL